MNGSTAVVLRPVRAVDAGGVWSLLRPATDDLMGMPSLPRSPEAAERLCIESGATLSDLAAGGFHLEEGAKRRLLFVLDDTTQSEGDDSRRFLGLTGVTFKRAVPNLAVEVATSADGMGLIMASSSSPWTRTELDSTYLGRSARGRGLGTLVSRGRFLFLLLVSSQIPSTIASHLRGRFDPNGSAPFWRCFGTSFAPWPTSSEAEEALARDPALLAGLAGHRLPLTAEVLESLGPVNAASLPAFHLLQAEGLVPNGMYDPIDGGPTLVAEIAETHSGRQRVYGRAKLGPDQTSRAKLGPDQTSRAKLGPDQTSRVAESTNKGDQCWGDALVSVAGIDRFRAGRAPVLVKSETLTIDPATAAALKVGPDALLAAVPLDRDPGSSRSSSAGTAGR